MKNFIPTLKRHWIVWLVLAVIIIGLGFLATGEFRRWWSLKKEIERTETDIVETQDKVEKLEDQIALVTDPAYLEKEARRTLNVKREGEEVFIVAGLDTAKKDERFSLKKEVAVEESSEVWENMKAWWRFFFH